MANILVFAGDMSDAAQQRRIAAFKATKNEVSIVAFHKNALGNDGGEHHLDLGKITNENLGFRAFKMVRNILKTRRFVQRLSKIDVIYARNLDMLLMAWLCSIWTRHKPHLVYEVLDIHGIFFRGGWRQKLARGVERLMLKRISRLVVSSPDFLNCYFRPLQGFHGEARVLENKLWLGPHQQSRPSANSRPTRSVIRIGWVGNIRCPQTLQVLLRIADTYGQKIEIHIHGQVHDHAISMLHEQISLRKNVVFHGSYRYPDDLQSIYQKCDLVWAQDLWQSGKNSDWLIPNRLYEAAWFGCPSLALANTMTGQKIKEHKSGYVVRNLDADLDALISGLSVQTLHDKRCEILSRNSSRFLQSLTEVQEVVEFTHPKGQNLPDFIVIGSMRAGTTTLYDLCDQHPEIGVSKVKETDFFIRQKNYARGLKWYQGLFPKTCKVRGEFSPNYTKSGVFEGVPQRMKELLPNVKLIYIARNPVDRAASQYKHGVASGQNVPALDSLIGSNEWEHIIDTSRYFHQIKEYMSHFPRSQILILDFRELCQTPELVLSDIAEFLGVTDSWPSGAFDAKNSSQTISQIPPKAFRIANSAVLSRVKMILPRAVKKRIRQAIGRAQPRELPNFDAKLRNAAWLDVQADADKFELVSGIRFEPPDSFDEFTLEEEGAH